MLTLLKRPPVSGSRVYEIAGKTGEPRRNTNAFCESALNQHILLCVCVCAHALTLLEGASIAVNRGAASPIEGLF